KSIEIAAAIARRDARFVEQPRRQPVAPAVAADDAPDTVGDGRRPAGVIAAVAGHEGGNCKRRKRRRAKETKEQRRSSQNPRLIESGGMLLRVLRVLRFLRVFLWLIICAGAH